MYLGKINYTFDTSERHAAFVAFSVLRSILEGREVDFGAKEENPAYLQWLKEEAGRMERRFKEN